jgi:hypothetical protein
MVMTELNGNLSNKLTRKELIKHIIILYRLSKALNEQFLFLQEYINNDYKKLIKKAIERNNYFIKRIDKQLPIEELDKEFEEGMKILDILYEQYKTKTENN